MRSCDRRFEMRLPHREKDGAEVAALREGITVAELMRRALRAYLRMPEPLHQDAVADVVELRRQVNEIEARNGHGELAADIERARAFAKDLLRR